MDLDMKKRAKKVPRATSSRVRTPKDVKGVTRSKARSMAMPAPQGAPYVQLSFTLPRFYLRVLDGEAAFLGHRRAQVLELLVLRKAGVLHAKRSASEPKYQPSRRDFEERKRYIWHCRPEIKAHLDHLIVRMGNVPPRAWVILALNEWIGLPAGVSDL